MNPPIRRALLCLVLLITRIGVSAAPPAPEAYRKYALTHEGDAARGAELFANPQRLGCINCHSVDGSASKAGPDLFSAGDAFGRRDLVDAVLTPSATIAPGYGTVIVETTAGTAVQGVLKQTNLAGVQLMGADGKLVSIPAAEISKQYGSPVSLMPEGLQATLSLSEFTDLIDYLTTLRQRESSLTSNRGMPADIPQLAQPAVFRPFLPRVLQVPPVPVQTGLTSFRQIPGAPNSFLILHQKGLIWKLDRAATGEEVTTFADLTQEVFSDRGPNGLLDVAFHPRFRENHRYYLYYQVLEEGKVTTHIVEKQFSPDFQADSGQPARLLVKIVSVAEDHSGGCLQFGPDGFLYFGMGDTGPHNDPNGHAQNMQLQLGKMMRIDVDHAEVGRAYAIPADNPYRDQAGIAPEIWACGFRNPWRFSFDRLTGELWLADVGQDRVEELDLVQRGGNYGWNVYEAFEPFSNQYRKQDCNYTAPVFAYRRKYGKSITGGFVYRGDSQSSFYGAYVCGDYVSKRVFALTQEHGVLRKVRQLGTLPQAVVSFSQDESGNLYAVGYEGMVYRIDLANAVFE